MRNKIKFIEVKSEIGAGTRGASLGIDALKIAALDYKSNLFSKTPSVEIKNENRLLFEKTKHPQAIRIPGVVNTWSRVAVEVTNVLKSGDFPIVLAGDHSSAGGTIAGIKKAFPKAKLGVIWIDAHADLHSPYTTPSGNMHGMPLAAVLNEDNLENKLNTPDKKTIEFWNKLKKMGGTTPMIAYEDLVYIALRDMEPEEKYLVDKYKIKVVSTNEVKRHGVAKIAKDTLQYLSKCTHVYVSFDVDSMDSSISKGTGTPVRNGITEKEAAKLCSQLVHNRKVCCFEMVEINPTLDKENLMAENSFEILQQVVAQLI
ncbi:MAG: arginase [Bacteroidia bacterium]|nr:arginase [Bacteroidia bacterium]